MEGALERDHGRPARRGARDLDRVLDGLGAGVEERCLRRTRERGYSDEALCQLDVDLIRDYREVGVEEALKLRRRRLDDLRMRVTDCEAADAAREVDEGVAVDVRQEHAVGAIDDDREGERERRRDDALLPLDDRP